MRKRHEIEDLRRCCEELQQELLRQGAADAADDLMKTMNTPYWIGSEFLDAMTLRLLRIREVVKHLGPEATALLDTAVSVLKNL